MAYAAETAVCACGDTYQVRTYAGTNRRAVLHYECPPCEASSQQIAIMIAYDLDGTEIGRVIARIAR